MATHRTKLVATMKSTLAAGDHLFDGLKLRFLTIQPLFVVENRPKPDNLRTRDRHVNLCAAEVQN